MDFELNYRVLPLPPVCKPLSYSKISKKKHSTFYDDVNKVVAFLPSRYSQMKICHRPSESI